MALDDYREGWAVVDDEGLKVRTVSDTRRAAIVNWLVTEAGQFIVRNHTDEQIDALWDHERGDSRVTRVKIVAVAD